MKLQSLICFLCIAAGCTNSSELRREISLNGIWEITKTDTLSDIPAVFKSKIPVPGLVDLATPSIEDLPSFAGHSQSLAVPATDVFTALPEESIDSIPPDESWYYNNSVYWYKRTFTIDEQEKDVALLKINKAMYHTRVFVNGNLAGENYYNFTPTLIDILPFLKPSGEENVLIISVGCRNNLPNTVVRGDDFEKTLFIPGIYDDVKLILSGAPFISNVQTVPDLMNRQLRVVAEIKNAGNNAAFNLDYQVSESISKKEISSSSIRRIKPSADGKTIVDFIIPMGDFTLWSPETPFLYNLNLSTGTDNKITRFGMRSFETTDDGVVLLNGKTYYMRGTNTCLFRFFEDSERGLLPWDRKWVAGLHELFKSMHWNSIRYTIGPAPESWYEIADSVGFLIQDEYPIWKSHVPKPDGVTSISLAKEYEEWMRERWNHPCVVIWDGQNESVYDTTALAINLVRGLDLSNRPWDNGWAVPASESDVMESHKYFFYPYYAAFKKSMDMKPKKGLLNDFFKVPLGPNGPHFNKRPADQPFKNPVIMNEYTWMWVNRDGSTTSVTDDIFAKLFPYADTNEKRLEAYAKFLGMETEFWRSHRKMAGVLYFSGLSYSRSTEPRGVTSDNFKDVKNLEFDPYFIKYLKPAFSPVGIMIDFWDEKLKKESEISVPLNIINDTYEDWNGNITLSLSREDGSLVKSEKITGKVMELGREVFRMKVVLPNETGKFRLTAEIDYKGESVKSVRDFSLE